MRVSVRSTSGLSFSSSADSDSAFSSSSSPPSVAATQLAAALFPKVQPQRVVGAAGLFVFAGCFGGHNRRFGGLRRGRGRGFFLLLGLDHIHAGFRQHGHGVLDLLGGHFVGRQGGIQLVVGNVAALLALLDELLELGAKGVEQGGIGPLFAGVSGFRLGGGRGLGRHSLSLGATNRKNGPFWPSLWLQEGEAGSATPAETTLLLYGVYVQA